MKPSNPVDYARAAAYVNGALVLMPTDPDEIDRQQRQAAMHVDRLRARVLEENARALYWWQLRINGGTYS